MAKKLNLRATKSGEEIKKERLLAIVNTGEELGNELIEKLSDYGASREGLTIETYAMCKAMAALMVIAADQRFNFEEVYWNFMPTFIKEMRQAMREVNEEENS